MKIFLHEFPSSEGECFLTRVEVRVIKFRHYVVTSNKYWTIMVRYKWCDVKVQVVNIEVSEFHTVVDPLELATFKDMCIDLFTLFNKYDEFYWLPKAQIPRGLGKRFFDQVYELYHNPL